MIGSGLGLLNCDIENYIWRHLLNILNDRIVEVRIAIFSYPGGGGEGSGQE